MNVRDLLAMSPTGRMLLRIDSLGSIEELEAYRAKRDEHRAPYPGENEALALRERELRAREPRKARAR